MVIGKRGLEPAGKCDLGSERLSRVTRKNTGAQRERKRWREKERE